jgi:uncharacterized protein (TIGR03437 family)
LARFDAVQNTFAPVPIDLSSEDAVLTLYGTGIRHRTNLANVKVKVGSIDAGVEYASQQGQFDGLDQLNVRLPKILNGRGEVTIALTVEGKVANLVTILIQ